MYFSKSASGSFNSNQIWQDRSAKGAKTKARILLPCTEPAYKSNLIKATLQWQVLLSTSFKNFVSKFLQFTLERSVSKTGIVKQWDLEMGQESFAWVLILVVTS